MIPLVGTTFLNAVQLAFVSGGMMMTH